MRYDCAWLVWCESKSMSLRGCGECSMIRWKKESIVDYLEVSIWKFGDCSYLVVGVCVIVVCSGDHVVKTALRFEMDVL